MKYPLFLLLSITLFLFFSCSNRQPKPLFKLDSPKRSGLSFVNHVMESDSFNVMTFSNIYTGGGVGVGDFNGDGLADAFLGGNMVSSKLFLNQSTPTKKHFLDVTETAGITTNRWISGVSVVDINQDGRLDLYLCSTGSHQPAQRANLLFVNQGNNQAGVPQFLEMAQAYGLADTTYTTQSAVFDYDQDGDLDVFLAVNYPELYYGGQVNIPLDIKEVGERHKTDRLYRNEGTGPNGHPVFQEVSLEAGIIKEGYSLGVVTGDLNQDGLTDIYLANDFLSDDVLYINNGDGTFTDRLRDYFDHTSYAGMGADLNDINNDGRLDVVEMDMLPRDNQRLKSMIAGINYNRHARQIGSGYSHQYTRNTLQINNGPNAAGRPSFSEVSQLANIHDSDWSWSVLMGDYDNDGHKDLWITNGFRRDLGDLDFINYGFESTSFQPEFLEKKFIELAHQLPGIHIPNFIFRNDKDLQFQDKTEDWGLSIPSYSNGAVHVDFDQDGDLELLTNNLEEPAFLFWNQSIEQAPDQANFIKISLQGEKPNLQGIGAKVTVFYNGNIQYHEHYPSRGYLSSMEQPMHFGLGQNSTIDSITIDWPDGRRSTLKDIPANQTIQIDQQTAPPKTYTPNPKTSPPQPKSQNPKPKSDNPTTQLPGLNYLHQEAEFIDFNYQPLIPHRQSQNGPGIAVGDVDNNGLDDVYVGGGRHHLGQLFLQTAPAVFAAKTLEDNPQCEDLGSLFFDADKDGDLDLYLVSGSVENGYESPVYRDRLWVNDGAGNFTLSEHALPTQMQGSGTTVSAADFDRDGDLDLFVGGGPLPGRYPLCSRSYLLRNDTDGKDQPSFSDITEQVADLSEIGIVKSALWTDYNGDQWVDLILVGEFMPICIFENQRGKLVRLSSPGLEHTGGWWNSIAGADFDHDGDIDYMLGNFGENTKYQASVEEPLCIYMKDFDNNGTPDPVMCEFVEGRNVPVAYRMDMVSQLVHLKAQFPNYTSYAKADIQEVLSPEALNEAQVLKCETFATSYLENLGDDQFELTPLPMEAQIAPVFGLQIQDVNQDDHLDILMVGNFYGNETSAGRYDAFEGCVLLGKGNGAFDYVPQAQSGLYVPGDARGMAEIIVPRQEAYLLVSQNRDSLKVVPSKEGFSTIVDLAPDEVWVRLQYVDGKTTTREYYYGSGYLSQSSRKVKIGPAVASVVITNYQGQVRKVDIDQPEL